MSKTSSQIAHSGESSARELSGLLSISALMAVSNILIVVAYSSLFGWEWFGRMFGSELQPEHWGYLGGLVGLFAMVIRLVVILVLFTPFTICSCIGFATAINALKLGSLRIIGGLLVLAHGVLMLPIVILVFSFCFGH